MEGIKYFSVPKLYLLSDKGGCDMAMAQFSTDDILNISRTRRRESRRYMSFGIG